MNGITWLNRIGIKIGIFCAAIGYFADQDPIREITLNVPQELKQKVLSVKLTERVPMGINISTIGKPDITNGLIDTLTTPAEAIVRSGEEQKPTKKVLITLGGTSGIFINSGNWNHVFQNFKIGKQIILGNGAGDTLESLRTTTGDLTGYGVVIKTQFQGETLGQGSGGVYPSSAIQNEWNNPGSRGTGRIFAITGVDNSKTYTLKMLGSAATFLSGSHLVDYAVTGASGGGTVTGIDIKGNVKTTQNFVVVPKSGAIYIKVIKNKGLAAINVVELAWEEGG